jgi:hypothetical protein
LINLLIEGGNWQMEQSDPYYKRSRVYFTKPDYHTNMADSKVTLVGVGGDSTNIRPVPNLVDTDTFDYIPIPETWLTADQCTYGEFSLESQGMSQTDKTTSNRVAADEIDAIRPFGSDGEWINDAKQIANHPMHYDPNFEELTFGDKRGRGGRGSDLAALNPGDVLGFYTGIEDGEGKNRYIWGYFTVREVADLQGVDTDYYRKRLRDFPENAHTKRLKGAGKAKHEGGEEPSLVLVDGMEPAALLEHPVKISTTVDQNDVGNTYWLKEAFIQEFNYDLSHHNLNDETGLAGVDIKHALTLDLDPDSFRARLQKWQDRQYNRT